MLTPKQIQILNMILYVCIRCKLNILQNLFYFVMISHLSELIFVICISNMNYCSALVEKSCEIYLCIWSLYINWILAWLAVGYAPFHVWRFALTPYNACLCTLALYSACCWNVARVPRDVTLAYMYVERWLVIVENVEYELLLKIKKESGLTWLLYMIVLFSRCKLSKHPLVWKYCYDCGNEWMIHSTSRIMKANWI